MDGESLNELSCIYYMLRGMFEACETLLDRWRSRERKADFLLSIPWNHLQACPPQWKSPHWVSLQARSFRSHLGGWHGGP